MSLINEVKLGDIVAEISMGPFGSDIKTDNYVSSGVPIIRGGNLTSGRFNPDAGFVYLTKEKADSLGKANAYPDDVLITHRGTLGQVGIIPKGNYDRYVVSQSLLRLKIKTHEAHPFYVYYFLKSPIGQYRLLANTSQTGVPAISQPVTSIRAIKIPLPPLPVQRRIADILGTLDDKIELNRRMNATLEEMARALFKAWFVDFEPVRAKLDGRWQRGQSLPGLPAHLYDLFPDQLVDSELGEIPKGWGVGKLADMVKILSGGTPSTTNETYWNGLIPWYTVKDAPNESDVWVIDTEKRITELGVKNSAAQILPSYTTIISARGTVGKLALTAGEMAMNQSCFGIRDLVNNNHFYTYYLIQNTVGMIQQSSHGTVFDTITRQTFSTINVIIPDQDIRKAFDKTVQDWMHLILEHNKQNITLSQKRDLLLPGLLTGKLLGD